MRAEILEMIQNKLKEINLDAELFEPNWEIPHATPAVWIELASEEIKEGFSAQERKIPITIFIAERVFASNFYEEQINMLNLADQVEELLTNYITQVQEKKIVIEYAGCSYFSEQARQEEGMLTILAIALKFKVKFRR